jgi:hypothetical protein
MSKKKQTFILSVVASVALLILSTSLLYSWPTIYPRGVTIYNIAKVEPGYILFNPHAPGKGAMLIDNATGNIVKFWKYGGMPPKLLPNGNIFLHEREMLPGLPGYYTGDLTELTWDGQRVWQWKGEIPGRKPLSSPFHHDFQRLENGNTLVLTMDKITHPNISDQELMDDGFYEVTPEGKVVWQLQTAELFDQFGYSDEQKKMIYKLQGTSLADWAHCNDLTIVPPNKWYDQGDQRFKPGNILTDYRELDIICIIDKDTRKILWKLGPNYPDGKVDQIIGQHDSHMIPKGLPGAGNILIFDNGGEAGYPPKIRGYSRVVEVDPVKKEIVWKYEAVAWRPNVTHQGLFFSNYVCNSTRLRNGNTFISEGWPGRLFEVTRDGEIVWEYLSPWVPVPPIPFPMNYIYRAYKYPKDYAPQFKNLKAIETFDGKPMSD